MAIIGSLFSSYTAVNGNFCGFVNYICHAFDVTQPIFKKIIHRFVKTDYTTVDEVRAYEIVAQRDLTRAEFLWDELKQLVSIMQLN